MTVGPHKLEESRPPRIVPVQIKINRSPEPGECSYLRVVGVEALPSGAHLVILETSQGGVAGVVTEAPVRS